MSPSTKTGARPVIFLDAGRDARVRVREVVVEHDVVAGFEKRDGGVRADEAHAAREENAHDGVTP